MGKGSRVIVAVARNMPSRPRGVNPPDALRSLSQFGSMEPVKRRIQNQNVAWPCNKSFVSVCGFNV